MDYRDGHVPGAVRWFWREGLWHATDRVFPTPGGMADRLGEIGISEDDTIVLASDRAQWAVYAYWVFTLAGVGNVRILDVVHQRWVEQDRPLSRSIPRFDPVAFEPGEADYSSVVGRRDVLEHLDDPDRLLLDALPRGVPGGASETSGRPLRPRRPALGTDSRRDALLVSRTPPRGRRLSRGRRDA